MHAMFLNDPSENDPPYVNVELKAECLAHAVATIETPASATAVTSRAQLFYDWCFK